jgi:hypothetical protein
MNYMKNYLLTVVLFLIVATAFPQARIQVIHNSADAAVEMVDVWLDQTLLLDNFKFRNASPFMDAPAGVQITIAVTNADSPNPDDPLWSDTYTLTDGEAYVMVAEGIISASGYDPATPFDIAVFPGAEEIAGQTDNTDMLSHHGSTDAPTIDIYETSVGLGQIIDNLSYAEFNGYQELSTKDYIFEVRDETGSNVIAAYRASFLEIGLKGKAITMVTSGFLYPENNSDGPAFGLWVTPASASGGHLIELPVYDPKARVQIIHNSADAAAAVVDVWLDQTLLIDNFAFRTASAFLDIPAEKEITIAIKGPDSQDPDNPLWSDTYSLTENQAYIMVAEGIISGSGYNPPTPFDIAVYPQGREVANQQTKTDILVEHGSTDASIVDVYETGVGLGLLIDNLGYGQYSDYLELDPLDYIIEVRDETGTTKLAAYKVPLETMGLDGYALTVVASGFLNPQNNSNGPALGLWMATAAGGNLIELPVYDPKARVQVIHNCADAAAAVVDVWLNDELILDNFAFRTASPFINVPALQEFTIAVKGADSQNPENPLWSQNYTFPENGEYILVAEGILSTSGYDPPVPFSVAVYPNAREEANNNGQTDVLMHHGSTDTPTIDIVEVGIGLGLMVDNLAYGQFAGYFGLATVNYIFQVRDETGITKIAAYSAPLATMGLEGEAISIIASGFLVPGNNSGGPEFGLYVALASGGALVKLPVYAPTAKVQIIHNSADTAASVVDVWLNQTLLVDNLAFRNASPFINLPANEQISISVKGADSQDPYNPYYFHSYELTEGETYIMVAEGIVSASGFEPPRPFEIALYTGARENANILGRTDILVHHGATDAPAVDIVEVELGAGTLISDLGYSDYSSYLELPTIDYVLEVRDASNDALLGTFRTPLQTLGLENKAITIVASGFLDPSVNSDGAPFGLWAAVPEGGPLLEMPLYVPSALAQIIHNSADASAAVVDVWLDDELLLDNFAFRTATPFLFIPANTQVTLAICGPDSQDPSVPLWSSNYTLVEDEIYIMVADGIISPAGYEPASPFTLHIQDSAKMEAMDLYTEILILHGSTDAPTVDVVEPAYGTLFDNLAYGQFDGYLQLPTANYALNVTDESGTTVVASFSAPLADLNLAGKSLTLLASGFLDPSVNSNGPEFGLLAVKADGTALMLTNTSGIKDSPVELSSFNVYPNPAVDQVNVSFELKLKERVSLEIMDMTGRIVKSDDLGMCNTGVYNEMINVKELNSGMYLMNIRTGSGNLSKKLFKE